ncbi:MAG: hypothetical protein KAW49_07005 [Anaerolineae bacterium]|nr:hypothetical protein [Anaerolineae bacterium]
MKTVRLGKTGLQISRVGMGGIPITRPTEDEAIKVIRCALDLDVNFEFYERVAAEHDAQQNALQ